MAKDPAFLFYPGDWLGGTMGMTFEEKGAYMELLMLQFHRGHMPEHMIKHVVGSLWVRISCKFIQDGEGMWYNERLEMEQHRRKNYTASRRANSTRHMPEHMVEHMPEHMENENENNNTVNNKVNTKEAKKFKKPELTEVSDYMCEKLDDFSAQAQASKFIDYYTSNGWKVGRNPMKDWKAAARNWITNIPKLKTVDHAGTSARDRYSSAVSDMLNEIKGFVSTATTGNI